MSSVGNRNHIRPIIEIIQVESNKDDEITRTIFKTKKKGKFKGKIEEDGGGFDEPASTIVE